jgi:hypothetical protein
MVKRLTFFVAVLFASGVNAAERMQGLVEVPALHANLNAGGGIDTPRGPVTLFAEPSPQATVAVVVRDRRHLESREHDYEQVSAVVYEQKWDSGGGFWYKLRYSDGKTEMFGWLSHVDAGQFRRYYDLVHPGLTIFTNAWDNRLYERPEGSAPFTRFEQHGERPDVRVADARYGKDPKNLWLLVVIVNGSICGDRGDGGMTIIATGWVPAYAENGAETVWYYSRGC